MSLVFVSMLFCEQMQKYSMFGKPVRHGSLNKQMNEIEIH